MSFQDIEKGIKSEKINSRFRLAHIASKRARELNEPKEDTLPLQVETNHKVTTNAVEEIISEKVNFTLKEDA